MLHTTEGPWLFTIDALILSEFTHTPSLDIITRLLNATLNRDI
ncbi:hypothetical protein [Parvularcula sp. IMCC14364]|nr:hypothetical protein [Parvularcula sp. IMCC14364]